MIVWEEHGTEMKDILIMHFIAKTHTYSGCGFAGVMATAGNRAELHYAINDVVRSDIVINAISLHGNIPLYVAR